MLVSDLSVGNDATAERPNNRTRRQYVNSKGRKAMAEMTASEKLKATYEKAVKAVGEDGKLNASEKDKQIEQLTATFEAETEALKENESKTGKGTRIAVASTRGRNTQIVKYSAFDTDSPDTLPDSVAEFVSLSGISDESQLVAFLITGYNDNSFRIASDPVAEFVNPVWSPEVAKSFKDSVKTLVKSGVFESIEAAVAIIKPQVDAKFATT